MGNDWREFEKLVSQIEKQLVPKGAVVKSPDRIKDRVTGQLREVDVSIRYKIGSAPILITVECCRRSKVQDDTWIEQLAKKREKIGADLTIAVTSSNFTEPAIKSAEYSNIRLRRIKDITDTEISGWIRHIHIQKIKLYDRIEKWSIEVEDEIAQFSEEITKKIERGPNNCKIIFRAEDDLGLSIQDLLNNFYRWQSEGHLGQESYTGLEGDSNFVRRRIVIDFTPESYYTITENGKSSVRNVKIDLASKIERDFVPISTVYQYTDLKKEITQIASGSFYVGHKREDEYRIFVQPLKTNK